MNRRQLLKSFLFEDVWMADLIAPREFGLPRASYEEDRQVNPHLGPVRPAVFDNQQFSRVMKKSWGQDADQPG